MEQPTQKKTTRACTEIGCGGKHQAHGYCYNHYRKARRRGEFGMCPLPGCLNGIDRGGICSAHYARKARGDALDAPMATHFKDGLADAINRGDDVAAMSKIEARCTKDASTGCWIYARANGRGYGELALNKTTHLVHRLVAKLTNSEYLPILQVHHKCAVRLCCNPDHLQVLTSRENRAEMMERRSYTRRIEALEGALRQLAPGHALLRG